jgi:hypothetical protein
LKGIDDKVTKVLKMAEDEAKANEEKARVKTERETFGNDFYSKSLRRSARVRRSLKRSSSISSSNSSSDDDDKKEVDDDGFKSYDLIPPNAKENKFNADGIKLTVSQAKDGKDLGRKFKKLKSKYTKFDVPNGNI